jgi:diguanylate cyclase (GGDEF)-like protein/PAS domain S-box-containing protein
VKAVTFSLRWQIILLSSLVLALMAGAFAWQQHEKLARDFEAQRAAASQRQAVLLNQLFTDEFSRQQILAGMFANLPALRRSLRAGDPAGLKAAFDPLWSELNLGASLETVHFFDPSGRLLAAWGQEVDAAGLAALAMQAGRDETPAQLLSCQGRCVYLSAVPLVERGRQVGVIVLGSSLQDIILAFRRLAGAELAVLAPRGGEGRPYLSPLRAYLVSVSGGPGHAQMLQGLTEADRIDAGFQLTRDGRRYRLHPLPAPLPGARGGFLVIEDVTQQLDGIRQAIENNAIRGVSVLTLAVLLLYTLLMPIMRRFRRMTEALPLLGEGQYARLRASIPPAEGLVRDEVDDLGRVATELADTLEHLDGLARRQMEQLAHQAQELQRERDFITGLLDTAPALIVTHTADGRIQLANAHAIQASGRGLSDLERLGFIEAFFSPDQHAELRRLLNELEPGETRHSEGHFLRPDGSEREVVWFHSVNAATTEADRTRRLSVGLDVTAHKQAERRLSMLVDHDAVTGLLSSSAFQRELDLLLASAHERGALFVCDIDEFRAVNEVSGHERGDAMLALFARKATTHEPLPTLAARLGGDEFAFYYSGMSVAEAIVVARQLNQSLVGIGPALGLPKHSFTSCVGIAFSQDGSQHADGLIANAETALTQARQKGEGNWHLYSPNDPYQVDKGRRVYWSDELERALAEKRLLLHFQPILDLRTRLVSHWEALIRLHASDGSLVMPGQFMGVAETTGQVRRIGRWAITEAARAMRHGLHAPGVRLALNLSGRSLDDEETLETLRHCLLQQGISGDRFILEITETAALADIKSAARLMARYRELGCAFSLDDFGVGYTSFQYLKELPVDSVKIDGSFIVGIKRNRDDQVFVKALTEAVHGFGKKVVAEFVEDGETLDILQDYGVDYAQGYYIGRPSSRPALSLAA